VIVELWRHVSAGMYALSPRPWMAATASDDIAPTTYGTSTRSDAALVGGTVGGVVVVGAAVTGAAVVGAAVAGVVGGVVAVGRTVVLVGRTVVAVGVAVPSGPTVVAATVVTATEVAGKVVDGRPLVVVGRVVTVDVGTAVVDDTVEDVDNGDSVEAVAVASEVGEPSVVGTDTTALGPS